MPTFVHTDKCDGCGTRDVVACAHICPHDLMILDVSRMKAFNQEPEQCWECQCCVKACPQDAVEVRSFQDWVPMGTFPNRTTPVGSIDPYRGKPTAGDIRDQRLFTEAGKVLAQIK